MFKTTLHLYINLLIASVVIPYFGCQKDLGQTSWFSKIVMSPYIQKNKAIYLIILPLNREVHDILTSIVMNQ